MGLQMGECRACWCRRLDGLEMTRCGVRKGEETHKAGGAMQRHNYAGERGSCRSRLHLGEKRSLVCCMRDKSGMLRGGACMLGRKEDHCWASTVGP